MTIRIHSISVTPTETTVGKPIIVTVAADEIDWNTLKGDFESWGEVKWSFANWNKVKDYIYSKPVIDDDGIISSDNFVLFGYDGKQVSVTSGYTSKHDTSAVDDFIREVTKLDGG